MNKNKKKTTGDLSAIRTLDELRTEKLRLELKTEMKENDLRNHMETVTGYFSWANMVSRVVNNADSFLSVGQAAFNGFTYVWTAIRERRAANQEKKAREEYHAETYDPDRDEVHNYRENDSDHDKETGRKYSRRDNSSDKNSAAHRRKFHKHTDHDCLDENEYVRYSSYSDRADDCDCGSQHLRRRKNRKNESDDC